MAENALYLCVICMVGCVCKGFNSDHYDSGRSYWLFENSFAVGAVSLLILVLLSVLLVALCGGCTDMEVGSENHPASCGPGGNKSNYGGAVTDANTHVLLSSHSLQDESNSTNYQGLPYSLNPSGPQGFTGYDASPAQFQQGQSQNPYQAQPYGSSGVSSPAGYGAQCAASAPPPPGAHRPAVEPPPPSYNESVQQSYVGGWR